MSEFSPILAETRDAAFARTRRRAGVKKGRIKAGVAGGASGRSHLPAVRAVTGVLGVSKVGSKTGSGDHVCGHNGPECLRENGSRV